MPESQNVEWKSQWKDEYLEWICGYANAQGGKLYLGCDDEGNVTGLPNARKLLEDIPNKVRQTMGIAVAVNLLEADGKEYIEIDVPSYPIGISCRGIYYYRSGSTWQVLTGPALEAFLLRKRGVTWDNLPIPVFSLADVDDSVVAHFKEWAAKKGRIEQSVLDEPKDVLLDTASDKRGVSDKRCHAPVQQGSGEMAAGRLYKDWLFRDGRRLAVSGRDPWFHSGTDRQYRGACVSEIHEGQDHISGDAAH